MTGLYRQVHDQGREKVCRPFDRVEADYDPAED